MNPPPLNPPESCRAAAELPERCRRTFFQTKRPSRFLDRLFNGSIAGPLDRGFVLHPLRLGKKGCTKPGKTNQDQNRSLERLLHNRIPSVGKSFMKVKGGIQQFARAGAARSPVRYGMGSFGGMVENGRVRSQGFRGRGHLQHRRKILFTFHGWPSKQVYKAGDGEMVVLAGTSSWHPWTGELHDAKRCDSSIFSGSYSI